MSGSLREVTPGTRPRELLDRVANIPKILNAELEPAK